MLFNLSATESFDELIKILKIFYQKMSRFLFSLHYISDVFKNEYENEKIFSVILVVILFFTISVPALVSPRITPRWTNTLQAAANISPGGKVYTTDIIGNNNVNKITCTMVLYEKGWFGILTEVSRHSEVSYRASGFFSSPFTCTSGKSYKLEATAVVYKNGVDETITVYSEKTA